MEHNIRFNPRQTKLIIIIILCLVMILIGAIANTPAICVVFAIIAALAGIATTTKHKT